MFIDGERKANPKGGLDSERNKEMIMQIHTKIYGKDLDKKTTYKYLLFLNPHEQFNIASANKL